jgi:hypothetical protein
MIATAVALLTLVAPARVQVGADEFGYTLSRPAITAGPAIVQLANFGEDGLPDQDGVAGPRRRTRGAFASGQVPALVLGRRPPRARDARGSARQEDVTAGFAAGTTSAPKAAVAAGGPAP